ncbi:MAG: hypothetical protein IJH43_07105 [Mogibacterium sp.]|nr:hypothetical protein [Mogibacterium sp.]
MKLKTLFGKRGSYILEATVTLPVFLIAVMLMSSVILIYACIEDMNFIAANEMRRGAAEAVYADTSLLIPYRIKKEALDDHSRVINARLTDFGYRTSRWGKDELILMTLRMKLGSSSRIGIHPYAEYDLSLVTRAYVGRKRNIQPMSKAEMEGAGSEPVFIFPKRGEKYHSEGCAFLKAASVSGTLTPSVRSKYSSCPLCRSRKAGIGSHIYYFPSAGEDYHLPGCPSLQRNYVEIDKKDALARGYTPCSKCGG